jgi:endoglucanase
MSTHAIKIKPSSFMGTLFNPTELPRLKTFVNQTTAKGMQVILDPHNYARYKGKIVGSLELPNKCLC